MELDQDVVKLAKAIRQVESGGNYAVRSKDGSFGAYQFIKPTWDSTARKYGVNAKWEEATPAQQNEVAYKQIKEWKDKGFNIGEVASMWNAGAGRPNAYKEGLKGTNSAGVNYNVASYAKKVALAYQQIKRGYSSTQQASPEVPTEKPKSLSEKLAGFGNALIESEKNFGKDIAQGFYLAFGGQKKIDKITQQYIDNGAKLTELAKRQTNPELKKKYFTMAVDMLEEAQGVGKGIIGDTRTPEQIVGDAAGVALDILSAGSYGKSSLTSKSFQLAPKVVKPLTTAVKKTVGDTLKTIGQTTAIRSATGAGTGYAFDVSQNLQNGKTGLGALQPGIGTVVGATIPIGIGGIQAGRAITRGTAYKFINSLIKPSKANFSYGKDPGRTVSELGIVGNNLDDFANNVNTAKKGIGSEIGGIYHEATAAGVKMDARDIITEIDTAINNAASGGKNNQGIVTTLKNIRDSLLYKHQVNADGVIERVGNETLNLSKLTPDEGFALKQEVANRTQFTGRPSDDKTVNSILKGMYGKLKEKLNNAVSPVHPEILKLNQQFADLTSAEIAIRNREAIIGRSNLISLKTGGFGTAGAIIAAISTGGAAVPVILAGATAAVLEKAMGTTAVKTRIAAWLGKESPGTIRMVLNQNPQIKTLLYRVFPILSSKLGN